MRYKVHLYKLQPGRIIFQSIALTEHNSVNDIPLACIISPPNRITQRRAFKESTVALVDSEALLGSKSSKKCAI